MSTEIEYGLDDGHGMGTSGKRTDIFPNSLKSPETGKKFMHENEFNRAVVKYLDQHLRASGIKTIMLAPGDSDVPLPTRVAKANRRKLSGVVSVHANALTGKFGRGGRGIETFVYMGGNGKSEKLGRAIHKELVKGTKLVDRGVKKGNHLYMINRPSAPAVLVECGFMDDLREAMLLLDDKYRRECAEEIARGICVYEGKRFVTAGSAAPIVANKPSIPAPKDIDTEKGIGTARIVQKELPMRKGPDVKNSFIRSVKEGELYYVYEVKDNWYRISSDGWVSNNGAERLVYFPHPKILYRVRKTWADVESQEGAFYDLDSAKMIADELGLSVFDDGKEVYKGKREDKQTMYRVRKTWADAKSQKIAAYNLDSAKDVADEYELTVFDEEGKVVYVGKPEPAKEKPEPPKEEKPEPPKEEKPEPPVEDPEPEEPAVEVEEKKTAIIGTSIAPVEQMVAFLKSKNPEYKPGYEVAEAFIEVGKVYGVRGDIAFCQSIIETGWFKFDGGTAVTADQHNFCGLGVVQKGVKGHSFDTVEDGVRAQIQHLYAYASEDKVPEGEKIIDPRFHFVAPRGKAPNWEDLSMKWAMNKNYGTHILALFDQMMAFEAPAEQEEPEEEIDYVQKAIEAGFLDGENLDEPVTKREVLEVFGKIVGAFEKE